MYTSLLALYKQMMFPKNGQVGWTMSQIDEMDVHFFYALMNNNTPVPEKEVYLSDVW